MSQERHFLSRIPPNETLVGRDFIREEFYSQNRGQIQRSRSKLKQPDVPFSTAPVPHATKLMILNSDHGTYVPFKTLEVEKQHGVAEAMQIQDLGT